MGTYRKAVMAVLLAREHLPFIRSWCEHHAKQGFHVFLYDNTGSRSAKNASSVFFDGKLQTEQRDKRNCHYGAFSAHLTDEQCSQAMAESVNGLPVTIISWRPTDDKGLILHHQVEAYVDFVHRFRSSFDWAAFLDADEYLYSADGWVWDDLIDHCESLGCRCVELSALRYENRWTKDGKPRDVPSLKFCFPQVGGVKNFLRLDQVSVMDTHQGVKMGSETSSVGTVNVYHFGFRHYAEKDSRLKLTIRPSSPSTHQALPV